MSTSADAQTASFRPTVWPGYPGAVLIAPQQQNLKAPALYRSVNDMDNLEHPVGISQICERDLSILRRKGIVSTPQPVTAAGVQNQSSRVIGGKIGIDAQVVSVNAEANYDQIVTLSTGAVQVYESDDDDIARTVLRNVGSGCRKVIAGHLNQRRWVFVAAKAIQAYDYEAVFERVTAASASGSCLLCRWFTPKAEITGRMTDKNRASAAKTFVTIALVPSELDARQSIVMADVEEARPRPASRIARAGRQARSGPAESPQLQTAWAMSVPDNVAASSARKRRTNP